MSHGAIARPDAVALIDKAITAWSRWYELAPAVTELHQLRDLLGTVTPYVDPRLAERARELARIAGLPGSDLEKSLLTAMIVGETDAYKAIVLQGDERAIVETNRGSFTIRLRPNDAPNTVKNLVMLAKAGYYTDSLFNRVIPDFLVQGGAPSSRADAGYSIADEQSPGSHVRGAVSLARSNKPNSGSTEFFIMLRDDPRLDGSYTVFGGSRRTSSTRWHMCSARATASCA